jgi:hypothetical protein
MADIKELQICIKFRFNVGEPASETYKMLWKRDFLMTQLRIQTFKWNVRHKIGHISVEEFESLGHPPSSPTEQNVGKLHEVM